MWGESQIYTHSGGSTIKFGIAPGYTSYQHRPIGDSSSAGRSIITSSYVWEDHPGASIRGYT